MSTPSRTTRDDAMHLLSLGFAVFPCKPDKKPYTTHGFKDATTSEEQVRLWWERWPLALVGVPVPPEAVVLDLDGPRHPSLAADLTTAGFDLPDTRMWQVTASGGEHLGYLTDGREVPSKSAFGGVAGLDTRVGDKGYVIAWQPHQWVPVSKWGQAPAWLYAEPSVPASGAIDDADAPLGTRNDILSFLGTIVSQSRRRFSEDELLAILLARRVRGTLVNLDTKRPWSDSDLEKLASEAAKWEPGTGVSTVGTLVTGGGSQTLVRESMDMEDLLLLDLPPTQWAIECFIPEGLALIAAPPKTGKSVLMYQVTAHCSTGAPLFGHEVPVRPVRYYALEDGKKRSQKRLRDTLGALGNPPRKGRVDLQWGAPPLGGALEAEVGEWLDAHPLGFVIIDVLAKVRPVGTSKSSNAYDVDYSLLSGLQNTAKTHPGSTILVVTHDRKAGSDDWVTRVTGTRGVTGSADTIIYIDRPRGKELATIRVTGRDVDDIEKNVVFDVTGWRPATMLDIVSKEHPTRQAIFAWLADNGPAWPKAIADGIGAAPTTVKTVIQRMVDAGELVTRPDRLGYRVPETDD